MGFNPLVCVTNYTNMRNIFKHKGTHKFVSSKYVIEHMIQ
jgi:hypothetical protein